jgi:hypothetical protein
LKWSGYEESCYHTIDENSCCSKGLLLHVHDPVLTRLLFRLRIFIDPVKYGKVTYSDKMHEEDWPNYDGKNDNAENGKNDNADDDGKNDDADAFNDQFAIKSHKYN